MTEAQKERKEVDVISGATVQDFNREQREDNVYPYTYTTRPGKGKSPHTRYEMYWTVPHVKLPEEALQEDQAIELDNEELIALAQQGAVLKDLEAQCQERYGNDLQAILCEAVKQFATRVDYAPGFDKATGLMTPEMHESLQKEVNEWRLSKPKKAKAPAKKVRKKAESMDAIMALLQSGEATMEDVQSIVAKLQ